MWFADELLDLRPRFFLEMSETDNHICYLHPGVIDVVLDIDFPARIAQEANKRVAQDGIAQVPNVRGLVGIDAGVLDENLAWGNLGRRPLVSRQSRRHLTTIHAGVDVPAPSHLQPFKTLWCSETAYDLLGNFPGGLAQFPGEFEGQRKGVLTQFHPGWLFDDHAGELDLVLVTHEFADVLDQPALKMSVQEVPLTY
jgi:hypothetical protein